MKTSINYSLTFLGVIPTIAVLSIILILNPQTVYSKNPEVSYLDVNDTSSVSKFSVAAWFKTSNDYKSDAYIVNKAGDGGNLNYGIWMTSAEEIRGGFETSSGKPVYATSPLSYSDGKWHYAVVTFDGSTLNLYVDGVQVDTQSASGNPANGGSEPVRVGANSNNPSDYFVGSVDEVRVWKTALTYSQVFDATNGKFHTKGQILYLDFSEPIVPVNATLLANQTTTNATLLANQTTTNATSLANQTTTNATSLANQTTLNETGIQGANKTTNNETGIQGANKTTNNETGIQGANKTTNNETGIQGSNKTANNETGQGANKTANNETGQGANKTAVKEFTGQTNLVTKNDTGNANGTNQNIESIKKPKAKNETGTTNETLIENQTSESKLSKENSLPKAFDQSVSVDQNSRIDINLVADDEDKDQLQFDITADPSHGSLDNFNKEKGTVTYIPQKDYSGDDKFRFRVSDNKGGQSEPANVDLQINAASQSNETENTDTGAAKSEELSNQASTEQTGKTNSQEKIRNETSTEQSAQTNSVEEPNQPPKADAGDDQYVKVGTQVNLDGGKSSDDDGKIVSYKWEQTDGPKVNIKNADVQTATFDVPESAADSKLTFKLTVVDDKDASSSDDVILQVGNVQTDTNNQQTDTTNKQTDTNNQQSKTEEQIKAAQNVPPKADAGGDQKAEVNSEVKLDGGKSSDDDGKIASYKWERTDGAKVDLKNADKETATFDVPESAADSKLSFKLTVVDDKDASSSDDVNVDVEKISKDGSSTKDDSSTKDTSNN
jgi:Concanavalin A-like lectin/glucanases superfamily/K319L-like, PKD domain/Bacterial Ig domain